MYIHIVTLIDNKIYPLPLNGLLLLLFIFMTYPKENMKENDFFFFENFLYTWGTHAEVLQEYKHPKSIRYGYGSIFGVPVLHR